ncbi:MAG: chorismate--pyruvate lyase family protein [Kiloniellaceae bacterium]
MKHPGDDNAAGPSDPFDPFRERFAAQFAKPAELRPIDPRDLTPFQRALLVCDGTVTKFIEVYTMEPVDVACLDCTKFRLTDDDPWLDARPGSEIARRRVILRGARSGALYAYAVASIVLGRLPPEVRERLEVQGQSLGRILSDRRMETRREVLWYGREQARDLPEAVRRLSDGRFLTRTYRIMFGGGPIALITEKFPE